MKDKAFHAHWRHFLDIKKANLREIWSVCVCVQMRARETRIDLLMLLILQQ